MNKSDLAGAVANKVGISQAQAQEVVESVFAAIQQALVEGDRVEVRGFGSFTTKHRAARTARNPKTGQPVEVPARRACAFKASKNLVAELSKGL